MHCTCAIVVAAEGHKQCSQHDSNFSSCSSSCSCFYCCCYCCPGLLVSQLMSLMFCVLAVTGHANVSAGQRAKNARKKSEKCEYQAMLNLAHNGRLHWPLPDSKLAVGVVAGVGCRSRSRCWSWSSNAARCSRRRT